MRSLSQTDNIVLIGMPGVGKSTVGVLLAKATRRSFVDTDVFIQAGQGRTLQEIIDADGLEAFCHIEEQYIRCLEVRACVIATGGSVVYSDAAMQALRTGGLVVHLDLPLDTIIRRIENLDVRGVVMSPGQTLASLYELRQGLYRKYADLTIACQGLTQDQVVAAILEKFR